MVETHDFPGPDIFVEIPDDPDMTIDEIVLDLMLRIDKASPAIPAELNPWRLYHGTLVDAHCHMSVEELQRESSKYGLEVSENKRQMLRDLLAQITAEERFKGTLVEEHCEMSVEELKEQCMALSIRPNNDRIWMLSNILHQLKLNDKLPNVNDLFIIGAIKKANKDLVWHEGAVARYNHMSYEAKVAFTKFLLKHAPTIDIEHTESGEPILTDLINADVEYAKKIAALVRFVGKTCVTDKSKFVLDIVIYKTPPSRYTRGQLGNDPLFVLVLELRYDDGEAEKHYFYFNYTEKSEEIRDWTAYINSLRIL